MITENEKNLVMIFHIVQQSRDGHSESRRTPHAEKCRLFKINRGKNKVGIRFLSIFKLSIDQEIVFVFEA